MCELTDEEFNAMKELEEYEDEEFIKDALSCGLTKEEAVAALNRYKDEREAFD